MDGYKVKNYLWAVMLLCFLLIALLSGCSSSPKVMAQKPQYCLTSQTIQTENNETVNSKTTLECTDDQVKRLSSVRLGMSGNCGEFSYWMNIGHLKAFYSFYQYSASPVLLRALTSVESCIVSRISPA